MRARDLPRGVHPRHAHEARRHPAPRPLRAGLRRIAESAGGTRVRARRRSCRSTTASPAVADDARRSRARAHGRARHERLHAGASAGSAARSRASTSTSSRRRRSTDGGARRDRLARARGHLHRARDARELPADRRPSHRRRRQDGALRLRRPRARRTTRRRSPSSRTRSATASPRCATCRVTHRWGGPIAFALDFLPAVGVTGVHRNVFYSVGYAGHGIAMASYAGTMIADLLARPRRPGAGALGAPEGADAARAAALAGREGPRRCVRRGRPARRPVRRAPMSRAVPPR